MGLARFFACGPLDRVVNAPSALRPKSFTCALDRRPVDVSVALVTGASSGIGRACAEHLARAGFRVYGTSRNGSPPGELTDVSGAPPLVRMDVTSEASVRDALALVFQRERRIDLIVNSAGMGFAGAVEDTSAEEARRQMEVNFDGTVRVCRLALPGLRAQRSGCIVNVGSMAGFVPIPYQSLYSASKLALEGFSAALRAEVRPFGIRVVMVRPGDHRTPFTRNRVRVAAWNASAYRETAERALAIMERDERDGPGPEGVGRLVVDIGTGRRRGDAYVVGARLQRALFALRHLIPEPQMAWMLRKLYRLGG
jgi:NAD(P)-dependent dehydrogenase (short-subunit alcohol dehydrogenase family)